ncbi:hypothetical protein [Mesorhizobium sp. B2-4-17]|uniref:hypothetical protein n=1 Tax=Mesorhizobium sp. B2-4-17 TaxID=2589932 RepID=UPI00112CA388|nr:hypothetical protein [Mesorhizobium sp. B2-4-17]TPK78230.1 hypothetical protein FJ548_25190 [Mesorhizobium sp. B2-4-17]
MQPKGFNMLIVLDQADFAKLSPSVRAEILGSFNLSKSPRPELIVSDGDYDGIDMTDVVDLDDEQVRYWMEAAQEKTKDGLRVIAEHGPVLEASLLSDAGIDNIPHFQSRTTIRTRTVTKNKRAFMVGWDEPWKWDGNRPIVGRYAVTGMTFRSLRKYFGLD